MRTAARHVVVVISFAVLCSVLLVYNRMKSGSQSSLLETYLSSQTDSLTIKDRQDFSLTPLRQLETGNITQKDDHNEYNKHIVKPGMEEEYNSNIENGMDNFDHDGEEERNDNENERADYGEEADSPSADREKENVRDHPIEKYEDISAETDGMEKEKNEDFYSTESKDNYRKNEKEKGKLPVLPYTQKNVIENLNFHTYSQEDNEFLKRRLPEMLSRAKRIQDVCRKHKDIEDETSVNMLWDTMHTPNILWCPIFKAASTTWKVNFRKLANTSLYSRRGKPIAGNLDDKAFAKFKKPSNRKEMLKVYKNSVRMIIVRHPFAKFLSVYRNKIENKRPLPKKLHYKALQKKIVAKYRKDSSGKDPRIPTFSEFVDYVIDSEENLNTLKDFKQVSGWPPFWAQCAVCTVKYNLVLKLETFDEDQLFLSILADLRQIREEKVWMNKKNTTSNEVARQYYEQLNDYQIKQLHRIFRLDFDLFGYDLESILSS